MQRIRIFRPEGDEYEYKKTILMQDADLHATGQALVAEHGVEVGDIAYWGDYYFRLDKTEGDVVRWTNLPPNRPEVQGLYSKAVEAERPVGDPWS